MRTTDNNYKVLKDIIINLKLLKNNIGEDNENYLKFSKKLYNILQENILLKNIMLYSISNIGNYKHIFEELLYITNSINTDYIGFIKEMEEDYNIDIFKFSKILNEYILRIIKEYDFYLVTYLEIKIIEMEDYIKIPFQDKWFSIQEDIFTNNSNNQYNAFRVSIEHLQIEKIFLNGSDYCDETLAKNIIKELKNVYNKLMGDY